MDIQEPVAKPFTDPEFPVNNDSFLDVGTSYNTKTIAAVVIGGTAITGGKGGYLGTIAGAVIMTILDDFLTIVSIPDAGRQVVQGIIIILLVLVYSREKKK